MNPRQFYDAVVAMRQAQRQAAQLGTEQARAEAARLEEVIDCEIDRTEMKLKVREMLRPLGQSSSVALLLLPPNVPDEAGLRPKFVLYPPLISL